MKFYVNIIVSLVSIPLVNILSFSIPSPIMTTPNKIDAKKIQGIIFDIDGTLADSWKLGYDATLVVLKNNNIELISPELYHQCTRYATPERLARHAGFQPGDRDFEKVGNQLATEFDDLYVGLVSSQTAGFFDGVEGLLNDIPTTLKVGALTNACVDYAHAVLKANSADADDDKTGDIYRRFSSIRGADNVPAPKPKPDGLFQVCEDLSLEPQNCVYIGDSPSDAVAADAAGMVSIGVTWGSHSKESLMQAPFTAYCSSVDEIRSLLLI